MWPAVSSTLGRLISPTPSSPVTAPLLDLPDTHGSYISQGYNLIGNVSTFTTGFNGPGDQVGTEAAPIDPKLGPLAANGGPTLTHALLANSPAIDQGSCSKGTGADQRGVFAMTLPKVLNADGGCDIGAFEAQPQPVVSIGSPNITEGDSGTSEMSFNVSLDRPSTSPVSVDYATEDFTGHRGRRLSGNSGTLAFPAGTTALTLKVQIVGDTLNEFNEAFLVRLTNPQGASVSESAGVGFILDNDAPPAMTIGDAQVPEGNSARGRPCLLSVCLLPRAKR
jgi:hypothetical protein